MPKHTPLETSAFSAVYFINFILSDNKPGLTERPVEDLYEYLAICDRWYHIPKGNIVWHNPQCYDLSD